MKLEVDVNKKYKEIHIIIQTPELNQEVKQIMNQLEQEKIITFSGKSDNKIYVLNHKEINMFYSQNGKIYGDTDHVKFEVKHKLYEIESLLHDASFIRISKSAIVNIYRIMNIEISFNGSLVVKFKNGHSETISRRHVTGFKKFIGLGGKS